MEPLERSRRDPLAAFRGRNTDGLAALRAGVAGAFAIFAAVERELGHPDWARTTVPLSVYAVAAVGLWALQRTTRGRLTLLASAAPALDCVFVYWLQLRSTAVANRPFEAGWTLALYVLCLLLAFFSLRVWAVLATAAMGLACYTLLVFDAGLSVGHLVDGAMVLIFAAAASAWGVRRSIVTVLRLVEREVAAARAQARTAELERTNAAISSMHAELAERHRQLRRAQEEARTLAQFLVHDLKSPLSGILCLTQVASSELGTTEKELAVRDDLGRIEVQAQRLVGMVEELLAVQQLEHGAPEAPREDVDLELLLALLRESWSARARAAGVRLEVRCEPGPQVALHGGVVQRMLDNLVANALDFVAAGNRIHVEVRREPGALRLAVRNDGAPIPDGVRQTLFEKRRGLRRSANNLGLGLYFCRLAAEAHGGTIALVDEPGWPVSFVARLSLEAGARPAPRVALSA